MWQVLLGLLPVSATPASGPAEAAVYVDASAVAGHVDPRFFGLFTEHIHDALDWKLPAQKVKGRGFESGDRNGDGVGDPWLPVGEAEFALDPDDSHPRSPDGRSSTSQRIALAGAPAGIAQTSIAVREGDALDVRLFVKADAGVPGLTLALARPPADPSVEPDARTWPRLAEAAVEDLPTAWEERSVRLTPPETVFPCALLLLAEGEGAVRLDQVSAIPESAVHGWRRDIVDLYEWLKPATLRYPGGNFCQTYRFADGLGPAQMRPVVPNPAWNNYPEPNNIGTDEFLRLCEYVGMEPILCLNIGDTGGRNTLPGNSTDLALRECAEWLEYCNGPADSEWGARRAANGHPEPYGVRLWEVGNEIGYGHIHGQLTAEQYTEKFLQFAPKLRATDPDIELIACGHDPAWNRRLVERAGDLIDFVAIHVYDNAPLPGDCMAHPARYIGPWLDSHIQALRETGATPETTRLAVNEWSYSWAHWGGADRAVAAASLLHECLKRADWIAMTNSSDSVVRFRNNEAMAFPDSECLAIALLAHHTGDEVLRTECLGPTFETVDRGATVNAVDAVASRSGDRLFVSLLNRSERPVEATLAFGGVADLQGVGAWGIRAKTPGAATAFDEPEGVAIVDLPAPEGGSEVRYPLAPVSATVLEFSCTALDQAAPAHIRGSLAAGAGARVTALSPDGSRVARTEADADGRFALEVPPGAYRLAVSGEGLADSFGPAVAVAPGWTATRDLQAGAPAPGAPWEAFDGGALDPARWEAASIEGPTGNLTMADGLATVHSRADSRYGLLSTPLDLGSEEALVIEARLGSFEGLNALMHLTTEGRVGQFEEFLELGVERGRVQVWGPGSEWTGEAAAAPATLKIAIGPETPSGRTVELFVNGALVQRAHDLAWLKGARPRVFLYGWGEGVRQWDWVRLERASVRRAIVLEDSFDALDRTIWTPCSAEGTEGAVEIADGALIIQGARDSRFGVMTEPIPQAADEALVVTARVTDFEGLNALLCLLGGGPGDYTDACEAALEAGRARAWLGAWSRALWEQAPPADLKLVAGPPREDGLRRVRVYVNDRFVCLAPGLPDRQRPLRVFLYQWSDGRTVWDSVRVERIDLSGLGGLFVAPEDVVG